MPAPSQSGTVTTTNPTPPGTSAPTPLRFNLSGAIGLALGGTPTANAAAVAASPAARIAPAPAAVAGPTSESVQPDAVAASPQAVAAQPADAVTPSLQTVQADGQLAPAVTSGSAPISHFLIGPDGKVYVVFSTPVNLANTSQYSFGSGCVLAEIDPSSGAPRCVDSSLSVINWDIGEYHGGSAPIQFDSSGAIYYSGSTTTGQTVLRRFDGSTIRNLITDNVMLNSFAVALNGTVVITGSTTSTGATWTRRVSPSGSLASLANSGVNFTSVFPDGNVYMGTSTPWSVARYVTASDHMDPEPWIADSTNPAVANEYFDAHSLCASPTPSSSNFCMSAGAFTKWSYGSPDGHEYVVTGSVNGGGLAQYYPTVKLLPSEVTAINVAAGVGNDVALAGTNGNGQNVLTLLDPATGAERELIGPNNEIEIYHLNYGAHRNEILFDGLRFSDNQYVVGEYNLSTGQLTVSATLSSKLTDLQSF
jgi:hypothetical protein